VSGIIGRVMGPQAEPTGNDWRSRKALKKRRFFAYMVSQTIRNSLVKAVVGWTPGNKIAFCFALDLERVTFGAAANPKAKQGSSAMQSVSRFSFLVSKKNKNRFYIGF